jgi:hypothetical protein
MSENAQVSMRIPVNEFELFCLVENFLGRARLQNVVELPASFVRVANPGNQ